MFQNLFKPFVLSVVFPFAVSIGVGGLSFSRSVQAHSFDLELKNVQVLQSQGENLDDFEEISNCFSFTNAQVPVQAPAQSGMTKARFNQVIDQAVGIYESEIDQNYGKIFSVTKDWENPTVNAFAAWGFKRWKLNFTGGLARYPGMTPDGYMMVVCHELGHHLAGYPFASQILKMANEGQSDYYAAQTCAKRVWRNEKAQNQLAEFSVDAYAKGHCDSVYRDSEARNLCYRTANAGLVLARVLAKLQNSRSQGTSKIAEPNFDTPDQSVVARTNKAHPLAQCRLDTTLQGAICPVEIPVGLIPGRTKVDGTFFDRLKRERIAAENSCTRASGYEAGLRPACWYHSRL